MCNPPGKILGTPLVTRIGLDDKDTEMGLGNLQFLKTRAVYYSYILTNKEKFVIGTGATAPVL
jgi:hypothetical protein